MKRLILSLILVAAPALSDELVIDRRSEWQQWSIPGGVVDLRSDGSIVLKEFEGRIDPLSDMGDYEHETRERGLVIGGIDVGSRGNTVSRLLDDDESTWWQPSSTADIDDWALTIDLGRLVLLESLQLVFPDTIGARPMRQFAVYVSEGMPIWDGRDLIRYSQVFTTILPNTQTVIDIPLSIRDPIGGQSPATGDNTVLTEELQFMPVQYIRIVPRETSPDAALAEIEAVAIGRNIAPGTLGRGGSVRSSQKFGRAVSNIFDGTVEKFWLANAAKAADREWKVGGQYFEWDLGVAFWLDQIVFYSWPPNDLAQTSFQAGTGPMGHEFEVSDGTPIAFGEGSERFRGPFDYERITLVDNQGAPRRWIFQHPFEARKTRYIFYHHFNWGRDGGWGYKVWEIFLYAPGHPAEVQLASDMISLDGVKGMRTVSWDADLPPGTRIEVRTKSGDEISSRKLYFDINGNEVDQNRYYKVLKSFQRGDSLAVPFEGDDWSTWSEPYRESGDAIKSPTPREFVRFRVSLISDDPTVTPTLRSLTLTHDDPLFQRAVEAEVFPRESRVGQWEEFTYLIRSPSFRFGDRGYDGILLPLQAPVRNVRVTQSGQDVGVESQILDDTLRIQLPGRVLRDSVEVIFEARLLQNPTFLTALLTSTDAPDVQQGVKPSTRVGNEALSVFLPGLAAGGLFGNIDAGPGVLSPNGDGVNDELILTFDLLKVDLSPQIDIHDLSGRLVRSLAGSSGTQQEIRWDGNDDEGQLVPPGVYLCRIRVEAGVGTRSVTEIVHVAY